MEGKNNNKLVILLTSLIIVVLMVLCVSFATGKINLNNTNINTTANNNSSSTTEDNNEIIPSNEGTDNYNSVGIDYDKFITKFNKTDFDFIKMLNISYEDESYGVGLSTDGLIFVDFNMKLANVTNVVDILVFNDNDAPSQYDDKSLYILDNLGNLYYYSAKDYKEGNLNATKLSEYTNVKKMFKYYTRKKNAGGCDRLIIESNNDYVELKSFCN